MNNEWIELFRAYLNWRMCSDPWPTSLEEMRIIDDALNNLARDDGYEDWVDAYHKI